MEFTRKHTVFVALFGVLVLLSDQVKVFTLWGAAGQYFTLFQLFGPIAGGFLGPALGVASVLLAEVASFAWLGKETTAVNILRLLPMLFAAYYFASWKNKKSRITWLVPIAAIALFVVHPVGQQAWYYALYWTIPLVAVLLPENLLLRSLGASFTAHAIGGIIWLYSFPTSPGFWTALIPVVAFERLLFAGGIAVSFVAMNTLLAKVESMLPEEIVAIDYRYALGANPAAAKR